MARIDDGDLERLKKSVSLEEVCRQRGIELKPRGRKDLIGRCPFHPDKNPSFVVTPDKNLFHCLGCNAGGSVIDLVMKLDGLAFKEAAHKLLTSTGLVRPAAVPPSRPVVPLEKANALLERVIAIYEKTFSETAEGKAYLETRGITDAGLFTRHRVGYAAGKLKALLPSDLPAATGAAQAGGAVRDELKAIGVLLDNGHERFAGCAVFPVFDPDGRLVTLYGRYTQGGLKRHVYLPDRSTGLWNAAAMKTYADLILVESVLDALSVMMAGHRNVIAIQGTNGLNEADIRTLQTHGVQAVTLLLDGDDAGRTAAQKIASRLKEKMPSSFRCRVLALPVGEDPNRYLVARGAEALAAWLAGGESVAAGSPPTAVSGESAPAGPVSAPGDTTTFTVTYGMRHYRIMGLEKGPRKLKATLRVEHAGKLHVDTLDFYTARARRILAMDLCRIFEETPETVEADLARLVQVCEQRPEQGPEALARQAPAETMTVAERQEAEAFGRSPTLCEDILADNEARGLIGERDNVLLLYLALTSRKRDLPLSVLILSSSGAGKTALQDAVLAFCPPEDLVKLTALSGKALFYKERLSLKHKVLALEEGDGAEEAMYAIRNLISAGELVSESTIKDLATGRLTTMENKVEGPSAVCFTTTRPDVDPETKSRFWVTSIDESRDQTRKILSFQRQQHLSDGLLTTPEREAVLRKHRNFQRLLKPLAVKNPYAAQLAYGDDRLQGRRDQPKYLNLIKAIAFLRQMRKEVFHEQRNGSAVAYVKVDADDIALANRLAHELLGHSLDELSRPGRDLLLQLEEMARTRGKAPPQEPPERPLCVGDFSFRRRDIRERTGWSNTRLHVHLKELVDFEYLALETGRNGLPFRYRLAWEGQGKDGQRFLLGLKDVKELRPEA